MRAGTEIIGTIEEKCEKCGFDKSALSAFSGIFLVCMEKFCPTCEAQKMTDAYKRLRSKVESGTHEWMGDNAIQPRRVPDVSKFKPSWKGIK